MSISGPQRVVAGAVALVVLACGLVIWASLRESSPHPARTTPAGPVAVVAPAAGRVGVAGAVSSLAILRDWDRSRSRAWAAGDAQALARLYVRGSEAGARDVAMLERWSERGLRVRGMAMQVLAVELRRRTARRLVLVVTDRLVGAEVVGAAEKGGTGEVLLPRDQESTRRLTFRRVQGRWLLAAAQDLPRPVASTASTSGSAKE